MKNNANTPYPGGDQIDQNLDGQIMKFVITQNPLNINDPSLTKSYNMEYSYPKFTNNPIKIPLNIFEVMDSKGDPMKMLFNG